MAQQVPHLSTDKKRVKVYELRNNDWYDRGTGFCTAAYIPINPQADGDSPKEPRVVVESEDQPNRLLLETRICKEDGFQKQQETLIVWTEPVNGVDMALSFQEADGCSIIWKFVNGVQQSLHNPMGSHEDNISDDLALDLASPIALPPPELGNLNELEQTIRIMASSATGRDALAKCVMSEDYIARLIPVVEMAEDLESLADLHRLCSIMKSILLLNDTSIIEHAVSDECVLGVVGALEYDPDFPSHKANHRQWLNNQGRYKEVVRIQDDQIRRKIHQTYRLQYLKDVVLARILDDPTFSVLNSLIFFNQVDIVQHLQGNVGFLNDLFGIFRDASEEQLRKKEAVLFIQQCCAIAKNLQPPARQTLYNNFLNHGLLHVINFGLRNYDVSVRVGATDILVSMIDHDPQMIRQTIYRQLHESQPPLTDTLIDLLLVEVDLGIKSQISDALKVLLDPSPAGQPPENYAKANGEMMRRQQQQQQQQPQVDPQQENFLAHFYEHSAVRLFKPLLDLEGQEDPRFSVMNDGIFSYLNEILCFYIRTHGHRNKIFIVHHNISQRFMQLITCREKHLQLVAIRFFRHLICSQEEFWITQVAEKRVLGPILDVLIRTLPRDNLLCSACLDVFDLIRKENIKPLMNHVVEAYRDKVQSLAYLNPFPEFLGLYDQAQGYASAMDPYFLESEEDVATNKRPNSANTRGMMEHLTVDPEEEAFWNAPEDEDESQALARAGGSGTAAAAGQLSGAGANGVTPTPTPKPLVDYASDEEADDNGDAVMTPASSSEADTASKANPDGGDGDDRAVTSARGGSPSPALPPAPAERVSEKRRREEDEEEDELGKLLVQNKRRNSSSASMNSNSSSVAAAAGLGRKKGLVGGHEALAASGGGSGGAKKINISITPPLKIASSGQASTQDSGT